MSTHKNTPSFSLKDREMDFISLMIEEGRFGNRTEVVRAALRLLEDYEYNQKTKRLRTLIQEAKTDVAAGKLNEYDNATALANDIIQRGRETLNVD